MPVFIQHGISKAVLYGSYAQGCANEHSDVDLLVDSGLRGFAFTGLLEDLFERINKPIDVIDVSHIAKKSKIAGEIQRTGIVIYEK
ncbi:MAG: nucleotidyltransferase domain-containing protein [Oscillospiraceae bacterium]|nr:nucleotidyltransferase domain-containing protein [Oscillospiraceae bacterium]